MRRISTADSLLQASVHLARSEQSAITARHPARAVHQYIDIRLMSLTGPPSLFTSRSGRATQRTDRRAIHREGLSLPHQVNAHCSTGTSHHDHRSLH